MNSFNLQEMLVVLVIIGILILIDHNFSSVLSR
ncbi:prepilin-type N-terminal cleavage/methylation domain-containing protein [Lutibacter sp.]|nr:prepilin-type N-terminal cleavage/methylation domain-containing protein [Lutibacter sp.]